MTTLVGIQGDGWCLLGADSKASDTDGSFIYLQDSKIFPNGPTLIAGSGAVRTLNILEYGWTAPRYRGKTPEEYMTRYFIPSLRRKLVEAGSEWKKEDEVAKFDNGLLIAVKGKIFKVSDDYSWETSLSRLYRGGSGGDYALGAMIALGAENIIDREQTESIARQAINAAITADLFSGGDVVIRYQQV
jgi:ATP-dependent protease HslVU (ClpYQ) peptidase subunit